MRDFTYDEETLVQGKNERDKLTAEKTRQFAPLVRWLKINFSEIFTAYIHVKALRAFVESVLRSVDFRVLSNLIGNGWIPPYDYADETYFRFHNSNSSLLYFPLHGDKAVCVSGTVCQSTSKRRYCSRPKILRNVFDPS